MDAPIFQWLNNIGSILGILTFFASATTLLIALSYNRRRRKVLHDYKPGNGLNHGLLITQVCTNKNEARIRTEVELFCKTDIEFRKYSISDKRKVELYIEPIGKNHDKEIIDYLTEFQNKYKKLADQGVNCIHWFHKGPIAISALSGAQLANMPHVYVYQYSRDLEETYLNYGPLKRPEP